MCVLVHCKCGCAGFHINLFVCVLRINVLDCTLVYRESRIYVIILWNRMFTFSNNIKIKNHYLCK